MDEIINAFVRSLHLFSCFSPLFPSLRLLSPAGFRSSGDSSLEFQTSALPGGPELLAQLAKLSQSSFSFSPPLSAAAEECKIPAAGLQLFLRGMGSFYFGKTSVVSGSGKPSQLSPEATSENWTITDERTNLNYLCSIKISDFGRKKNRHQRATS